MGESDTRGLDDDGAGADMFASVLKKYNIPTYIYIHIYILDTRGDTKV